MKFLLVLLSLMGALPLALPVEAAAPVAAKPLQKTIKDGAEYNAYIAALNIADPLKKAAAMEAFVQTYPSSVVVEDALEQAMAAYQQAGKIDLVAKIAARIVALHPDSVRALAVLTFVERAHATKGEAKALADMRAHAEAGTHSLASWTKPAGMTDAEFKKLQRQMTMIFEGARGYAYLNDKDYGKARDALLKAVAADPGDLQNTYQLGIAEVQMEPLDTNGFWHLARALNLAVAAKNTVAAQSMTTFAVAKYKHYHGSEDGWSAIVKAAGTHGPLPKSFAGSVTASPSASPSPAQIAVDAVKQNDPTSMSFSDWEFVLSYRDASPANAEAAAKVWATLQKLEKNGAAKLQLEVVVVSATAAALEAAVSDDNIKSKTADMHVVLGAPVAEPPAAGTKISVVGVIRSYAPKPFLFTMTDGKIVAPANVALPDGFYLVLDDASSAADAVTVPSGDANSPPLKVNRQAIAANAQIERASAAQDNFGNTLITIDLTTAGGAQMRAATTKNVGRRLAIVSAGRAISVVAIREPVVDHIQISGKWTLAEANAISASLSHH